ncbi:MAG: histidinol dehydrogenase [bacterium]|nr:MAG: histidinol dehydrogenase [bacterium]
MKFLDTRSGDFNKKFSRLENRFSAADPDISKAVSTIVGDVKNRGDRALFQWTRKLDRIRVDSKTVRISGAAIKNAAAETNPKLKSAIKQAYVNIKKFHARQIEKSWSIKNGASSVGQLIRPLERVGLYVPGGTASYPSTLLMTAIPALVAGVGEIAVCSPASCGKIAPAVLYAAHLCGIKEFYKVGGAQAVAAMAFGTKSVRKVDKIAGPGNAFVTEAKRILFGHVDIDMIAGPSEICIIADSSANPAWCAADILSQAEHDELAQPVLLSASGSLIKAVVMQVERQVKLLPRGDIARRCLKRNSYVIKTRSIDEAINIANRIAPEHLHLAFKNGASRVKDVRSAGAIFVGHYTPEVLGDYMAGPNHVLPTAGCARFFSPLGVYDFIKRSSVIRYSKRDFMAVAGKIAELAESEGLSAHARAASIRTGK